jgi:hypothetical protein
MSGGQMLVRAGKFVPWVVKPEGDTVWTTDDWARAATLEARFIQLGLCEEERRQLIPCAVWKAKFPGLTYTPVVEHKLSKFISSL